ncbi:purine-nucleoside phosphorylase [Rubripirellula reticaptiva]|uniref:Purine nucleoside phosphorylase n=1 Tax=Rubripirellula reticaptiva TaxID=2528013 RepID=A0A5C6FDE2_9BACT|nr:purine-nucleoside phosphorylase [Rubripirellula reticaptiva]TWU57689.1 Purine nucleoside phosphorylase 1 [Rubripirellula reticaptiva]
MNPQTAADFIRSITDLKPQVAIILGSGLGGLADKIDSPVIIAFDRIPGFGTSTASGHRGQLVFGSIESVPVVAMAGRFHRYEGWSNDDVAFPVDVMNTVGASHLIVSNAAGGVSLKFRVGDIVVLQDHINFMSGVFASDQGAPEKFAAPGCFNRPAMTYDAAMSQAAFEAAIESGFDCYPGTYLATFGPTYETRAEYRMMRRIGADVVGMSTVPEVLAASRLGMRILGLSMVSNVANPDKAVKASHDEVLEAGRAAEVKMEAIVRKVLQQISSSPLQSPPV